MREIFKSGSVRGRGGNPTAYSTPPASAAGSETDVIDDILIQIFGEAVFGRLGESRRAQLLARLFFGLLGTALGVAGAVYFVQKGAELGGNAPMRASMIAMFAFLAAFFLFNVALGRKWRWPGRLFVVSFVMLFVTRIVFGA